MKLRDLSKLRVGDAVLFDDAFEGVVVFNSVSGDFGEGYPREDWQDADPGVMCKQSNGALFFVDQVCVASGGCRIELRKE